MELYTGDSGKKGGDCKDSACGGFQRQHQVCFPAGIEYESVGVMKIKLINPTHLDGEKQPVKSSMKIFTGLTLPYLAALLGPDHEVAIVDEEVEDIDFSAPVDLVGITALTCQIPRGYWIAEQYRRRKVPVVMGGFHVSMVPEEALQHCDAVVKGEAEGLLEKILADAAAGRLQGVYERTVSYTHLRAHET